MLPKVATHILHSTTRAAAAVQNQTHAIRNVLQLQSTGPSSGSGSGWNNGPGPGGAKHNTGNRFYSFNGAGRAVAQANACTSQDGSLIQSDESDDLPSRRTLLRSTTKRARLRSSSLSVNVEGREERGQSLGVLQTVQLHARSRHAFSSISTSTLAAGEELASLKPGLDILSDPLDASPAPIRVRRNSISSTDSIEKIETLVSPQTVHVRRNSTSVADGTPLTSILHTSTITPAASVESFDKTESPFSSRSSSSVVSTNEDVTSTSESFITDEVVAGSEPVFDVSPWSYKMRVAASSKNYSRVVDVVQDFKRTATNPTVEEYDAALRALQATLPDDASLNHIVAIYNDMLRRSLIPSSAIYMTLMQVFIGRDHLLNRTMTLFEASQKKNHITSRFLNSSGHSKRIARLTAEKSFESAMSLFSTVFATAQNDPRSSSILHLLLRNSASQGIDAAVHIFSCIERQYQMCGSLAYKYLLQAYTNGGDLSGAQGIFTTYLEACQSGDVYWPESFTRGHRQHLMIFNQMISTYFHFGIPDKAIELVDQMIDSKTVKKESNGRSALKSVPAAASSTFTAVLSGFCQMGDVSTALTWFDRLLIQEWRTEHPDDGLDGLPMKPDVGAWSIMIDALATSNMVDDLNRLFKILLRDAEKDQVMVHPLQRLLVYCVNMSNMKDTNNEKTIETLDFLYRDVIGDHIVSTQKGKIVVEIYSEYISRRRPDLAIELMSAMYSAEMQRLQTNATPEIAGVFHSLQSLLNGFASEVFGRAQRGEFQLSFAQCLQLVRLLDGVNLQINLENVPYVINLYAQAKKSQSVPTEIETSDWKHILEYAIHMESESVERFPDLNLAGIIPVLQDISARGILFQSISPETIARTMNSVISRYPEDYLKEVFKNLDPSYIRTLDVSLLAKHNAIEEALHGTELETEKMESSAVGYGPLTIDDNLTKIILDKLNWNVPNQNKQSAEREAYELFTDGLTRNKGPGPSALGSLIQAFGRCGEVEKVYELYKAAQSILSSLDYNKHAQAASWFLIEDNMIIALAHAGNTESAHVHRARILEEGGAPSANAYGVLILYVKDTTDDTSNAMALFNEAMSRRVKPNQYLYNNIISKLAKARKADFALELFQKMKSNGIRPSSITYGAVIGACARVGDASSAEALFSEMVESQNFRPRVPPYNTMMQLYTTTKPNRERTLYYFDELIKAGVQTTAHTYKLLLDAFGTIEPVDIASMEQVFKQVQADPKVALQGTHFASLINAYGCVQKDLDKAVSVFESIPTYENAPSPDAVVFEALINAFVVHNRTDLIPEYVHKMSAAGVHMTAYIANFLIKGYAIAGDLEQARGIFESLQDPPTGMAAPHNHAPHNPQNASGINLMEPVYREPSTWEAMVRAELDAGYHDHAMALLDRLKIRQYPEAVYNRISGIVIEQNVMPA